jgi:hypothetical protein
LRFFVRQFLCFTSCAQTSAVGLPAAAAAPARRQKKASCWAQAPPEKHQAVRFLCRSLCVWLVVLRCSIGGVRHFAFAALALAVAVSDSGAVSSAEREACLPVGSRTVVASMNSGPRVVGSGKCPSPRPPVSQPYLLLALKLLPSRVASSASASSAAPKCALFSLSSRSWLHRDFLLL